MFTLVRTILILCLLLLLLAACAWWLHMHHPLVLRFDDRFFPDVVRIDGGDSITFINLSSGLSWPAAGPHPTHSSYSDFDPQQGIKPFHFWTFTFAQEGVYTFHDHFAPEIDGIVIAGANDISQVTDQNTCDAITDEWQRASCIEIYFRNISANASYVQARAIYEDIAPRYPNSCHSFSHDLGRNAYTAYLQGNLPEIGQEASSCAYGLWHGFTTAMQNDRGFAASKEFCATLGGATEELERINRMNCYHGIGIGLIPDPPQPEFWGKFQELIAPGLEFCDAITGDPSYIERCLTGIFHAMTSYMNSNLYGFTFNEDSLSYCAQQKEEHQFTCFITLVSALPGFTKNNLAQTVAILQKYDLPQELYLETFKNAAIMAVDMEATPPELGTFVEECTALSEDLRKTCIGAVINNINSNSTPGIEYIKAFEFCSGSWIRDEEKNDCYRESVGYASRLYDPRRLGEVCSIVPTEYQSTIAECSR